MRIALACPYAWDVPGGVQKHVRQLAAALRARGHEVLVVAPARSRPPREDAAVRCVGRTVDVASAGTVAPVCLSVRSFRRVRRALRSFAPDVVHVHEPFAPSTSMLAALAAAAPLVATFHSFSERSWPMELSAPLLRAVHRRIAASVAVSRAAAECVARVIHGRVEIVPNGVDAAPFAGATCRDGGGAGRGRVVLWAHRLEPRKGFPILVRAFARLAAELDDARLVVVGDGGDRAAIGLLPDRYRERVAMLGAVGDDELASRHAGARVFVAPALGRESFGIALVEAMAAGVPVVASDIPGYREVLRHGVEGLLVAPNDADALAAGLRRVLGEPALADALGRAGRERARRYSWEVVAPRLESIYARAAGAPAARCGLEGPTDRACRTPW